MTLNVRQRQFAIGKRDSRVSAIKTAYLGPCTAFYGVDRHRGLVFLTHLDLHACGLGRLVHELKRHTDGDLSGFEIYLATGMSWWCRLLVAGFLGWVAHIVTLHSEWSSGAAVVTGLGVATFFFWSRATLYLRLWRSKAFSISDIKYLKAKRSFGYGRCGVTLDANSELVQTDPYPDNEACSKIRFGARDDSCCLGPISEAKGSLKRSA